MTAPKHTPGPWKWYTSNSYRRLGTAVGYEELLWGVGYTDGAHGVEWSNDADAALIAAAPEMYEALRAWEAWWQALPLDRQVDGHEAAHAAITALRAALAKARGEAKP